MEPLDICDEALSHSNSRHQMHLKQEQINSIILIRFTRYEGFSLAKVRGVELLMWPRLIEFFGKNRLTVADGSVHIVDADVSYDPVGLSSDSTASVSKSNRKS